MNVNGLIILLIIFVIGSIISTALRLYISGVKSILFYSFAIPIIILRCVVKVTFEPVSNKSISFMQGLKRLHFIITSLPLLLSVGVSAAKEAESRYKKKSREQYQSCKSRCTTKVSNLCRCV